MVLIWSLEERPLIPRPNLRRYHSPIYLFACGHLKNRESNLNIGIDSIAFQFTHQQIVVY